MNPMAAVEPTGLTVLYDADCVVCQRARTWVGRQRQLIPVRFVAAGSPAAIARFPRLESAATLTDVTVITDEGAVLRSDDAWIAVLWAVEPTRPTSYAIAQGRRRRLFRGVKGAAETMRRLAAPHPAAASAAPWPAPSSVCSGETCDA